jgi:hypothetical protein
MIMSNIGTIVLSLYRESMSGVRSLSTSAETVTTTQVRLLSISNTLSRLISGPLADLMSPLTSRIPGDRPPSREYRFSRVALLSGTSLLLAGAFVYLELAIRTPDDLWILRYASSGLLCLHSVQCPYPVLPPVLHMVPPSQFCMSQLLLLFPYIAYTPRLAQTRYCILRLGKKGLWAQLRSNILRTPFRDTSLFIPLRIYLGTPFC